MRRKRSSSSVSKQALLVAEVVIDGGRRVAAALGEPAHREGLEAALDEQRLGGVENDAPRVLAVLEAAALGGGLGGRGVHGLRRFSNNVKGL